MRSPAGDEKSGWRRASDIPAPGIEHVHQLLAGWLDGRHVHRVELLSGGLMNRNCRLTLSDRSDVVLRLYDRDAASAAKEVSLLTQLRQDVAVPAVLYAEVERSEDDPPFAVLEFVDGASLADLKRSGDTAAIRQAAYDVGRLLARLQRHRCSPSSEAITNTSLIEQFSRSDTFRARVGASLLDNLRRAATAWDDHPAAPAMPTALVHGDFNARNILVRQQAGIWSVAAILDWEFAFEGPMYCDIGNFLRYEHRTQPRFEPSFSHGLRDAGVALEGDWFRAARMADLPAVCELLTRASVPDDVVAELLRLVNETLAADLTGHD
jgi:aminoglycoside phosphotransferase (APT) family kinase protein